MASENNENWRTCPKCGAPVLINPDSGAVEVCGNCAARSSGWGLYLGGSAIVAGFVGIALLVYVCITILMG